MAAEQSSSSDPSLSSPAPSFSWRRFWREVQTHIVAALIVGALTGVAGFLWGKSRAEAHSEFTVRVAALQYADHLREAIERAARAADTGSGLSGKPEDLLAYGRSIVVIRDDLRGTLLTLSSQLNSELDRLSSLLDQYQKEPTEALARQIAVTIRVLRETWPSRQLKIDTSIRRLLEDLNIERVYFRDRR